MKLTLYLTRDYGNEPAPSNAEKQTQSNPTYSELVEPISKGTSYRAGKGGKYF